MGAYCIYVRAGDLLTLLPDTPAFVNRDEAEQYAEKYWLEHPELLVKGVRAVEAHECSPSAAPTDEE